MADYDNKAFGAMNAADPDMNITGGAIDYSKFEMDMSPREQKQYKKTLLKAFNNAYKGDPKKGKLSFGDWLGNLKHDYIKERSLAFDDVRRNKLEDTIDPGEYSVIESADILNSLFNMHTGRLEDSRDLVEGMSPEETTDWKPAPLRRP